MKGHEVILKMRMRGLKPGFVFLNDYPCQTDWFDYGENATVCTHGDDITALDLAFLHGCRVSISATSESRAKGLFEACKRVDASAVAACVVQNVHISKQNGWMEVWNGVA